MSNAVAEALEGGLSAEVPAAVVKLLGTRFEGDVVDLIDELTDPTTVSVRTLELLAQGSMSRPGFTIRGGTTEVLRSVVARGLGLR
jgi:hypothetical protein